MMKLIVNGDIVYVLEVIEAPRSVNPNASRKVNELLVFGFNKRSYPKLYERYIKEVNRNEKEMLYL